MSASIAAYGRLGGDPRALGTKSGKPMTVTTLAVDVGEADAPPLWLGVVAFGRLADELRRHRKGDTLSASGRLQVRHWTDADGAHSASNGKSSPTPSCPPARCALGHASTDRRRTKGCPSMTPSRNT